MTLTLGDLVVLPVLGIVVALVVRSMHRDRKRGGCTGCSGNCSQCPSAHTPKNEP